MNLVLPGASSLLVEQREQRLVSSRAPCPPSPPCSSTIALPLELVGLATKLSLPGRVPQVVLQLAYLALALEGGRKKKGRKKEGREGRREGGDVAPTKHRRRHESNRTRRVKFFNPYSIYSSQLAQLA